MTTPPAPITAEIVFSAPDVAALERIVMAAYAVAEGAQLFRSVGQQPMLKVCQGPLSEARWRQVLVNLVEVVLPGPPLLTAPAQLDSAALETIADLAERCANLHAATRLPLPPATHLTEIVPALQAMTAQLRAVYVKAAGDDPWAEGMASHDKE